MAQRKEIEICSLLVTPTYEEAILALKKLQGNTNNNLLKAVEDSKKYLIRTGISLDDLNRVPIIHIAGTKGKGSTCAYLESIIRNHGFKTAFYTSPHLVRVRERIKINENEFDMPSRLTFMTVLAFHLILAADIDLAIVEVGIGGEYDSTNIIQQPICVGITLLEMDHMKVLGDDLSSIAWHKAGIFKANVPAYTVNQSPEAFDILRQRSIEKNCSLTTVSDDKLKILNTYPPKLGIDSDVQFKNAALAVQLAETFIKKFKYNNNQKIDFDKNIAEEALKNTKWPGRTQIIHGKYLDIYLDGPQTHVSMKNCVDCETNSVDLQNSNLGFDEQMTNCKKHVESWSYSPAVIKKSLVSALNDILDINKNNNNHKTMVLITGCLYFVGTALSILDENFVPNKKNIINF
ncbi:folylpolyglutamate synthase, mitochondrial-like [Aphidius gifuensis]|uniref:folylpolyglutamate synthase, mitochondrial-like n=1 Tax=Aphidius gifuensis TaxID=684658 RepID=UPI001CDCCBDA|nr:folylpolyglutamate synthase, mitochondrial-like [Aphidius gifuensis]